MTEYPVTFVKRMRKPKEEDRSAKAFPHARQRRRFWTLLSVFAVLALLSALGLLLYNNPVPVDSPSFGPVVKRRINALVAMAIAALSQSLATVTFQAVTNNRIITPSLLGYESLYTVIQTALVFFFGASTLIAFNTTGAFLLQVLAMIVFSLLLYGRLLSDGSSDIQRMLLIGVMLGTGLRSLSSFMKRMLSPSEFDILQAKLFGSVNNANPDYFPVALALIIPAALILMASSRKLNVLSLGRDVCTNLGLSFSKSVVFYLVIVSVLMSVSTALVGPMTFYGFLTAAIAYQLTPTYDYRYTLPMSFVLGFFILTAAYFVMYHVAEAQGVVSVIIEFVGGISFIILLFKRGSHD